MAALLIFEIETSIQRCISGCWIEVTEGSSKTVQGAL